MAEKFSKKTKIIIALTACVLIAAILITGYWFAGRVLFYDNPRFIIRELQLTCDTGYWSGNTEEERLRRAAEFGERIGISFHPDDKDVNTFTLDLAALRNSILRDQPEIGSLAIRRTLPDMLCIDIRSRIPRADTGNGFYIDDDGVILLASYYSLPRNSLPILNEFPNTLKGMARGEKVDSTAIMTALKLVRRIDTADDPKIARIGLTQIICLNHSGKKYIQCELDYPKNAPNSKHFRIQLPFEISDLEFKDIFERLIPALEDGLRRDGTGVIDLQYKGPAFSPQS